MGITEKEFAVIHEISNHHKPTQRDVAKKVGISLGLTNLIIKRLIKKGYIKIKEVPPRTVQYMLTPKGFAEKTKKSYQFTLKTISLIKTVKESIQDIIIKEYNLGARDFVISGNGELPILIEIALRDLNLKGIDYFRAENKSDKEKSRCYFFTTTNGQKRKVDVLSELSKRGVYY